MQTLNHVPNIFSERVIWLRHHTAIKFPRSLAQPVLTCSAKHSKHPFYRLSLLNAHICLCPVPDHPYWTLRVSYLYSWVRHALFQCPTRIRRRPRSWSSSRPSQFTKLPQPNTMWDIRWLVIVIHTNNRRLEASTVSNWIWQLPRQYPFSYIDLHHLR